MAQRFYAAAGRLIMSKPGYDAVPSLPDVFKIFDSQWSAGNVLVASGTLSVGQGSVTVSFPSQHYIPSIEVLASDMRGGLRYVYDGAMSYTATTNSFTVNIPSNVNRIDYAVYGV